MMQRRIRPVARSEAELGRYQSHRSPSTYSHFLEIDSPISPPPPTKKYKQRTSTPAVMNILRFGDDSDSDDEENEESGSAFVDHRFSSRTTSTQNSNEQSLSSFRFFDESPSATMPSLRHTQLPTEIRDISKGSLRVNTDFTSLRKSVPEIEDELPSSQDSFLPGFNAGDEEDLQVYVQKLLQGSSMDKLDIEEELQDEEERFDVEEDDIYQSYGRPEHHHHHHHHQSTKETSILFTPKAEAKSSNKNRISALSMASDVSAVPSLIFSDAGANAQRPSTILTSPLLSHMNGRPNSIHSLASIPSIHSIDSDRSWFMEDESHPSSPAEEMVPTGKISFSDGIGMGMSLFDDEDSASEVDEEESYFHAHRSSGSTSSFYSPDSPYFILMGRQVTLTSLQKGSAAAAIQITKHSKPKSIKTTASTATTATTTTTHQHKKKSSLSIETSLKRVKKLLGSGPIEDEVNEERPTSQVYCCASPHKRRSRRRTASSECIVLEALEKMNEVMLELDREDLNRKSVVGLDLPGNQVSVEAYGELWW
ncbi:hypothetical protein DFH27DRAFT_572551 [Peziza echinospora]|nr:hypothetical protein DFH27DRAFT_572551 [Peziza echinospora]